MQISRMETGVIRAREEHRHIDPSSMSSKGHEGTGELPQAPISELRQRKGGPRGSTWEYSASGNIQHQVFRSSLVPRLQKWHQS